MGWHGTDVRSFVRGILDLRSAGKSCLQTMLGGVGGGANDSFEGRWGMGSSEIFCYNRGSSN